MNISKEAMTLLAKVQWKTASDKEVTSFKNKNAYTLLPVTSVLSGHKIVGSRWLFKNKDDHSKKGRSVVLR